MTPRTPISAAFLAAQRLHQAGNMSQAEAAYRQVLAADPQHGEALHFLGLVLAQQERFAEAVGYFQQATKRLPQRPDVWVNLGESLRRNGHAREAVEACQRGVQLAPAFAEGHFNLGCALRDLEQIEPAIAAFRQAIAIKPQYARAHFNLGNVLRREGKTPVAVEHFWQAAQANPKWWEPRLNLAACQLELGETQAALDTLHRLQPIAPSDAEVDALLGDVHIKQGRIAEARPHYAKSLARHPERGLSRLRYDLLCDTIPPSAAAVTEMRAQALAIIERYQHEPWDWKLEDLHGSGAEPPMAWGYHGLDDRPLKEAYARLFLPRITPVTLKQSQPNQPHLGVVVTSGHEGVFDRCLGPLVNRLAQRGRLRVSLISTRAGINVLRFLRPDQRSETLQIPERADQAATTIAAVGVDGLLYWEIGTDSLNYFLPFFQPARRQWGTWGWPLTSGNPRVTGFLSSELIEPPNGDDHYTEELVRLLVLPTYYERPPVPPSRPPRARFGLSDQQRVLLCAQNLRKVQPGFDAILGQLLRTDGDAVVLLLADEQPYLTELFRARLSRTIPDVRSRVRILPRMPREEYLGLTACVDAILDPPGYGGGANTAFDAAAAGIPVITLRGEFHRGRWQTAVNQQLGTRELNVDTVDEYVRQALRVASDREWQQALRERITAAAPALFCDDRAVDAFEMYFLASLS